MGQLTSSSHSAFPLVNVHTHHRSEKYLSVFQLHADQNTLPEQECSVGIHPKDVLKENEETLEKLEHRLSEKEMIAVGETGLDNGIAIDWPTQEYFYTEQLKLAARHNLPVILHCVNAWDRCRFLHQRFAPSQPLIFHGFAKSSILPSVLSYEPAYISIGARLLQFQPLQDATRTIPLNRLFLETDDAEIDLLLLYEKLAEIKSLPLPAIIEQLYTNYIAVFHHDKLA